MGLRHALPLLLCAAWLAPIPASGAGEVCESPPADAGGAVSLMILSSGAKVQALAGSLARGVPVVARDAQTVIFRDGRVITADPEGASRHLNELGWSGRRIQVVASFPKRRAGPTRRRG